MEPAKPHEDDTPVQETADEFKELLGQRVGIKIKDPKEHKLYENTGFKHFQHVGSIRYVGKLQNNPKAGDSIWLGVEWDFDASDGGPGTHYGTVDGVKYFTPEFHCDSELYKSGQSKCCSFLRHGKVPIGGISISEGIKQQYGDDDDQQQVEELVTSNSTFDWRQHLQTQREITLQYLKISEVGPADSIRSLVPNATRMHLDKNLLYSWDQVFEISNVLPQLRTLVLSGNKFRKLPQNYLEGKDATKMMSPRLTELVLIDMSLDWQQIDILAPTMINIEQLFLVRNNCKQISSKFKINPEHFANLVYLNLEQNGIEQWQELEGFAALPMLGQMILNKNKLSEVHYTPGFPWLRQLSIEHNDIRSWRSFDELNKFDGKIEVLRCAGNPCAMAGKELAPSEAMPELNVEEIDDALRRSKAIIVGKMKHLKKHNGGSLEASERKDYELYYLKYAYEYYLRNLMDVADDKDRQIASLEDPGFLAYVTAQHPRFFQLVDKYGSPLGTVNIAKEGKNIKQSSARIELISEVPATAGKTLTKKLLLTMSVAQLKAMCAKLFKVEVLAQKLEYRQPDDAMNYELDEDHRQLSFFSMDDGGKVYVKEA